MNAVSMNNLWMYLQGLSLTASNRKWLAEKLIEPSATSVPPILHTYEEAMADLEEDYYEPDYDECGFNPYMGCYDFDC
jgi:hypothetical protein